MTVSKVSRYHPALVVLHWALALLIIAALALGALVMVKIPNTDPMKFEALRSHMGGGMAILVLMLVRLVIRSRSAHPDPATGWHGYRTGCSMAPCSRWLEAALSWRCRPDCSRPFSWGTAICPLISGSFL